MPSQFGKHQSELLLLQHSLSILESPRDFHLSCFPVLLVCIFPSYPSCNIDTRTWLIRQNMCAPKFCTVEKILLSGLFARQHWDRPDIILNKYAWHHLQEIYVMGLSKLSSSSVFNLFFTLLLHAHIPPSQVHTALPFFCYTPTFQASLSNLDRHPAWTDLLCTKHRWTH